MSNREAMSHKKKLRQLKASLLRGVSLSPEIRLVHRFTPRGTHRLEKHSPTSEPILGDWASSRGVATLESYAATTEYYQGVFPRVFKIVEVQAREVND